MTPRERAEQLWETWKKATFVASTRTIHAENYIRIAEQAITAAVEDEREACAKIALRIASSQGAFLGDWPTGKAIEKAIRARSTTAGGTK